MSGSPLYEELAGQIAQLHELAAEQARLIETLRTENAELRARLGRTPEIRIGPWQRGLREAGAQVAAGAHRSQVRRAART